MSGFNEETTRGNINIPPLFDGEHFEYWKNRLRSFYILQDPELWDLVEYGYIAPKNTDGIEILIKKMNVDKKTMYKMHHKFRTFMINVFKEFYKCTNKETKILRRLTSKWRHKITAIQEANDLNTLKLKELISSLRSHEIEYDEDEPKKRNKTLALKSKKKMVLTATSESEESDSDHQNLNSNEKEIAFISRNIQKMWHNRKKKFPQIYSKQSNRGNGDKYQKKSTIFYGCNEPRHIKTECSNIGKGKHQRKYAKPKKKSLKATWNDSEESCDDEQADLAMMAFTNSVSGFSTEFDSRSESAGEEIKMSSVIKLKYQSWYLYSGYSRHMTGEKSMLQELTLSKSSTMTFSKQDDDIACLLEPKEDDADKPEELEKSNDTSKSEKCEKSSKDESDQVRNSQDKLEERYGWKYQSSHLETRIIGSASDPLRTRSSLKDTNLFGLLSSIEPSSIDEALKDNGWILEMQEVLNEFERNDV
uniref:Uncharacterized protein LOC101492186 n=1 Tax=Cicer arietinum TaxID=3827 RepID=A0A1S3DWN7_CICAR|nr:uncharacterized protein LOC101492186 [Cicer arietinum]